MRTKTTMRKTKRTKKGDKNNHDESEDLFQDMMRGGRPE